MASATEIERLLVRLVGEDSQYQQTLDNAGRRTQTFALQVQGAMATVRTSLLSSIANFPLLIGGSLAAGAFQMLKVASDAEESASKFAVTFSDVTRQATQAVGELDKSFGLSADSAQQALANTGDLLSGFGFTQEAALDLSLEVQKLAVDLASFTNVQGGATVAAEALTKGLLGEREMMKQLGIAILEKDVLEQVAINRAKGITFESERQAKAIATLEIAMRQSKNAIGDYARTSGSLANQTRELKENIVALVGEIGGALIPIANQAVSALQGVVTVVGAFTTKFIELGDTIARLSPDVRKGLALGAQAEAESARLDRLIAEREAAIAGTSGGGQTEEQAKAVEKLTKDIDKLTKSLQEQAATFGMTADQAAIYRLKLAGASEQALKDAQVAADFIAAKEKEADILRDAAQAQEQAAALAQANTDRLIAQASALTEQLLTPTEMYNNRIAELSKLLRVGAITAETFDRAIIATGKTLQDALKEEDNSRRRQRRLTGRDFTDAGSVEAKVRAEEQRDLLARGSRDDKDTKLRERIEGHLRVIRFQVERGRSIPELTLTPANFNNG